MWLPLTRRWQTKEQAGMDPTIVAALIGAIATVLAVLVPIVVNRARREKGVSRGTIDQLLVPQTESGFAATLGEMLPKAKEVRICGWSLRATIDPYRYQLRELVQKGREVRILLLDPQSATVRSLDGIITAGTLLERKVRNWPPVVSQDYTKNDLMRVLDILRGTVIVTPEVDGKTLHVCNSLLPLGMFMVECDDGSGWLSVQIYPLHPDMTREKRLTFTLGDTKTRLWNTLKEQFDLA
jgi:hypothetical protein